MIGSPGTAKSLFGLKDLVSVESLTANWVQCHWIITSLWASQIHFSCKISSGPSQAKTLSKLLACPRNLSYRNNSLRRVGGGKKKKEWLEKVKIYVQECWLEHCNSKKKEHVKLKLNNLVRRAEGTDWKPYSHVMGY